MDRGTNRDLCIKRDRDKDEKYEKTGIELDIQRQETKMDRGKRQGQRQLDKKRQRKKQGQKYMDKKRQRQ